MPLHLLGKKSWNVYNQDNIERVRRDEAAARAAEEADEQRMQDEDARRRLQILRGEEPSPPPGPPIPVEGDSRSKTAALEHGISRERKKRKHGEDDTDFEMRLATAAQSARASMATRSQLVQRAETSNAPLVDRSGHIDLFPQDAEQARAAEEARTELEKRKKQESDSIMNNMKFADAMGRNQSQAAPWYSKGSGSVADNTAEMPSRDVWGNEDPMRKQREASRMVSSDPLLAMKQGAAKAREVQRERKRLQDERLRDIRDLREDQSTSKERRRRDRRREDGLEGFSLDQGEDRQSARRREGDREHRHRHHSHHRRDKLHRSRDRSRSLSRERRRRRHESHRGEK